MKKFFRKLFLFLIIFFLVDKAFIYLLLRAPDQEVDRRLGMVINGQLNKDIIILGSSVGARSLIAGELGKVLNKNCFNLSYPGSDIRFHLFLLKSLLQFNKKPSVLILVADVPSEFKKNNLKFRFDRMYPLARYDWINNEMIRLGEKNYLSHFFALGRINQIHFYPVKRKFTRLDSILPCGSMPISFQRSDRKFNVISDTAGYSTEDELPEKIQAYKELDSICRTKNIQLIVAIAPRFSALNHAVVGRLRQVTGPAAKFFMYNEQEPAYQNRAYYYDEGHLKINGAKLFTAEFANWMREEFYQPSGNGKVMKR